jgi:hypothetical protein
MKSRLSRGRETARLHADPYGDRTMTCSKKRGAAASAQWHLTCVFRDVSWPLINAVLTDGFHLRGFRSARRTVGC